MIHRPLVLSFKLKHQPPMSFAPRQCLLPFASNILAPGEFVHAVLQVWGGNGRTLRPILQPGRVKLTLNMSWAPGHLLGSPGGQSAPMREGKCSSTPLYLGNIHAHAFDGE